MHVRLAVPKARNRASNHIHGIEDNSFEVTIITHAGEEDRRTPLNVAL